MNTKKIKCIDLSIFPSSINSYLKTFSNGNLTFNKCYLYPMNKKVVFYIFQIDQHILILSK